MIAFSDHVIAVCEVVPAFQGEGGGGGGGKAAHCLYQLVYIELTELPILYLETLNRMISQLKTTVYLF